MPNFNEEWVLEQLSSGQADNAGLIKAVELAVAEGRQLEALSCCQLIEEHAREKSDHPTTLQAMRLRAQINQDSAALNAEYKKEAAELLKNERNLRRLIDDAGFDKQIAPTECLRRLLTLLQLQPGTVCFDGTWGRGVVARTDMLYHRIEIDFERKKSHEMALAYAAENLELLPAEHLLSLTHSDPQRIAALLESDQAGLVKLAISSFGPMNADELKEQLVPRVLDETQWKKFWEAARRELKQDPLFDLPAKRKDPLRILQDESELFGSIWFARLGKVNSVPELIEKLELCRDSVAETPRDESIVDIISDRLNFVIEGTRNANPDMTARALLLAQDFAVPDSKLDLKASYELLLADDRLLLAAEKLPARCLRPLIAALLKHSPDAAALITEQLPEFGSAVLGEVMDLLIANDQEQRLMQIYRNGVNRRKLNARMLHWLLKNDSYLAKWNIGTQADLVPIIFRLLENEHSNDDTADYKRLRSFCERDAWLNSVFAELSPLQRKEFTARVMQSGAWSSLDRKSLLARIIRLDPSMQQVVTPDAGSSKQSAAAAGGKTTSKRSYHERMRQLEKLSNSEIPANSREIAEARSHGDLRENAEFKAAKERQGILLRRQAEMEVQLATVNPTDFSDARTDIAGPGTMIRIEYSDGASEEYALLGEWDRDEQLNIISSNSRLAKALRGHRAGERAKVPTEQGEEDVTISQIGVLSPEIRAWIEG
jgi:transcription elongation GreA/GreB family factor